uniref:Uncharacterized protein n=1 Tax=Parascaris equorum TaxID=6256 RepID=A0A914RNE1_PAREQ
MHVNVLECKRLLQHLKNYEAYCLVTMMQNSQNCLYYASLANIFNILAH